MPIYAYRCVDGHQTDHLCRLDLSDEPKQCQQVIGIRTYFDNNLKYQDITHCKLPLTRVMTAPSSFPGADSWRR